MKKTLVLLVGLGLISVSTLAQQTAPPTEETQRRLRRTETRTTTTTLYPERDSIVALLKNRMLALHPGETTSTGLADWFTVEARITDHDGSAKTPAEYQATQSKTSYRNYRIRKLEINEKSAQSVEVYTAAPSGGNPVLQTATSQLRKDPDGRWRITEMRITSK